MGSNFRVTHVRGLHWGMGQYMAATVLHVFEISSPSSPSSPNIHQANENKGKHRKERRKETSPVFHRSSPYSPQKNQAKQDAV